MFVRSGTNFRFQKGPEINLEHKAADEFQTGNLRGVFRGELANRRGKYVFFPSAIGFSGGVKARARYSDFVFVSYA